MRTRVLALTLAALLLAACGGQTGGQANPSPVAAAPDASVAPSSLPATAAPTSAPSAAPSNPPTVAAPTSAPAALPSATIAAPASSAGNLAALRIGLKPVLEGFEKPTHVTSAGDGSGRLFVVEQAGRIWTIRDGARGSEPFLDIVELVNSGGNEQGLLSVAFHPRFSENGRFFVYYTARNGDNTLARYALSGDRERADSASGTVLFAVPDPAANHNGGLLKFGPDGYLYVGLGDGGGGGDPWRNGQSLNTLLGKLLRLDVDSAEPYGIPVDNPFVAHEEARPEIWAYGLRNPWRFSFDRQTGDLYIADVGQNSYEEVDFQAAGVPGGQNYGWSIAEGAVCFRTQGCEQQGLEQPVAIYAHNSAQGGCSITGGYVYRGTQFPQLAGLYLYTDYCSGIVWALQQQDGDWQNSVVGQLEINASSFGEDEAGELYLVDSQGGGLYQLTVE